jgi:hypothetical protein
MINRVPVTIEYVAAVFCMCMGSPKTQGAQGGHMFFKDVFVLVSRGTHCMTLAEQQHEEKSKEKIFKLFLEP